MARGVGMPRMITLHVNKHDQARSLSPWVLAPAAHDSLGANGTLTHRQHFHTPAALAGLCWEEEGGLHHLPSPWPLPPHTKRSRRGGCRCATRPSPMGTAAEDANSWPSPPNQ